jgi:hypothetical protein
MGSLWVILQSMALENVSFGFLKVSILDVTLGTVLYDNTTLPDKVARMEKAASRSRQVCD